MTDWSSAMREPLPGDWAARPLFRLTDDEGHSAICIETVPDDHPRALDGHRIEPVAWIYRFLKARGILVPEIYHADGAAGRLVMEDFGDTSWARWMPVAPQDQATLYPQAVKILDAFKTIRPEDDTPIPHYKNAYIFARTVWFLDFYQNRDDCALREDFIKIWDDLLRRAMGTHKYFVHGDFHPGNLMRLDDGRIGVLDVGGAFWGHGLYDLVNLLEDIRRDVPEDIKVETKKAYGEFDENAYAILHAQFYMRLLGQMIKKNMQIPARIPSDLSALIRRYAVLGPLRAFL